jgi:hypothetical protein
MLNVRGQAVLDCLNACYEAYRARLGEAKDVMTCTCDACLSIGGLELKFVLHHGEYIVQSVAGHQELLGPDVTVSHLLLKNHAADLVGRSAYALVTDPAAAKLDIPLDGGLRSFLPKRQRTVAQTGSYTAPGTLRPATPPAFPGLGRSGPATRTSRGASSMPTGRSRRGPCAISGIMDHA